MVLCIGYGGFGTSIVPFFSSAILTFLQTYGVVFALPNVRGGGEFGREWHEAGRRENKVRGNDPLLRQRNILTVLVRQMGLMIL